MSDEKQTVGDLRKLLEGLPDHAFYSPDWAYGPPGDSDPAVVVAGFEVRESVGQKYLSVLVGVEYLDDFGGLVGED